MREAAPLWERPGLRALAGDTLRPGGFELTDRAAEAVGVLPGWRVLDVGCGLGATMGRLRSRYGADPFGVEASSAQIDRRRDAPGVVQARGDCLPFGGGTFEAVFCECVLSLFADPGAGLKEFHRVLRAGGWLALSDLYGPGPAVGSASCADRAVPLDRTRALVEAAGFETAVVEDHTPLLRDLAAKLLFAGETGCGCGGRAGLGYYLLIARKRG